VPRPPRRALSRSNINDLVSLTVEDQSKEEAKFVFEDGCELLIVGAGQDGNVRLSPEASAYFDKKHCRVIVQPTPEAIVSFNQSRDKKIALMHVTC
jgi:hypothetical protein